MGLFGLEGNGKASEVIVGASLRAVSPLSGLYGRLAFQIGEVRSLLPDGGEKIGLSFDFGFADAAVHDFLLLWGAFAPRMDC